METREKAFDNELLTESEDATIKDKFLKASDETAGEENQCEKTNEGNEIILNEVSKEEVIEDKEVTETSYSTSHSEELTKDSSGEDELKDKLIEDKTTEALETSCQNEELLVEPQKSTENDIIEKQVVWEDKTVEDPGQASVARIETTTVTEEESSIELSQEEGTKDLAEGNQIIDDIQQPEERTNIATDKQIPRELDPIENTELTSSIRKEHAPIDLQDRDEESSQKAEVGDDEEIYPKEAEVDHSGVKITDDSGEDITKESTSLEDWTKVSSSHHVESSTKETLQVTQDMIEEREAKDETGAGQILLVEKPEEQSPAPSSKLCEAGEHGVSTQVNAVEEKDLKEVEILEKDSSDAKTREEIFLEKEENKELKAVVEEETIVAQAPPTEIKEDPVPHFEDGRKEEQVQNPTSAPPAKEDEGENTSTTEKIESEKIEEAEFLQDDNREDLSLQTERLEEDEALAKDEKASSQTLPTVKSEEQIPNPVATLPSEEHKHELVNEVDKTEEEKVKEEEMRNEDSDGAKTVVDIWSEKDETRGPQTMLEGETIASQVIAQESEEKKIEEEETLEDDKNPPSECVRELQGALEDGDTAAQTLSGENQPDQLHITSTMPSEEQEDETKETEVQEESPEQTREIEEASNVKMETREKAFDNELLTESEDAAIEETFVKASDETVGEENQCEKTNEGNEIILNEVSKEEVNEDEEVTETSYSTSHSEELTKDGSGEDELKDKLIEDMTNEALETTCQNEELLVEAQNSTENDIIEKQIVCEEKTVEDPGQASVARIETATVTEEESSIELSQPEGSKDLAEGNQIIEDIQQPEERTNIASDKQIPRELDPIENKERTSSISKEHAPIDLQDTVEESSQEAEVGDDEEIYPKETEVDNSGEKITDNSGEDIAKESMSVDDWTMVSSSDHVESSTKETFQVTQDMIEEREAKDETGAAQILLVVKPEAQSPAPSSKLPSKEVEHGVSTQVNAVEEKELKEVEILDKDSSDTKTREEICLEKEENKELKAVVEQETIAVQASSTEIKEDPVSHFEDGRKEEQLQNPTSAPPSKEEEGGNTTEKIESEKIEEAKFLQDDNGEDVSLQKERLQEDEALAKDENASSQTVPTLKSEEQITNPVATLPSEHKHETVNEVDKTEEEKVKEEMRNEDCDGAKTVVKIYSEKDETRGPQAVLEGETIPSQVIAQESEEKKIEEEETLEDDKSPQSECVRELQGALEDGATAAQTLSRENQPDQLHTKTSNMPSEEQEDETKETEVQKDESPEQTREIEEASNVKMETREKAFDNELLTESEDATIKDKFLKASDETAGEENQCEKTNEGNEIILNEVSKEEVIEDKEVTETSYSTSHSEELTKDSSGEDELKDKLIEDKTTEALETSCQNEELLVEPQKSTENDIIEKQVVWEDKTVEDPGQASVARIETTTVTEEESSIELSQEEGTKDLAEGNQIIDDIQQPEERTNIATDKQIPRELDPIENTELTSSIRKEHAPIDLQDRDEESSQKAEVGDDEEIYPKEAEVDHSGVKITDDSGEDITKESTSLEDWTKVSSSHHVESSTKETLQVTQDMIEEREAKDETGAGQILLVEKPEEQSPAPSSKLCEAGEHGVSTQVNAVEEKDLKEVEILEKDSSDAKTREEIFLEKEENKELKAVVEEETIVAQAPPTEIKEDPVPHFEDGRKEEQVQNPTSAPPAKEDEGENTSTTEKIESEKIEEAEFLQDDNREDLSLQTERLEEDEALAKDEKASSQTLPTVKSEEQIPNPVATLPSEEHKHELVNEVDKTEEEKVKEEEMRNEDSDGAKTVVDIWSEKDETRGPQTMLEGETIASQVIAQESEEKKIEEEETLEDDKNPPSECVRELQGALEDGDTAAQTLSGENQPDQLHITSTMPSEEQEDETKETEVQEESPEQTREIEEASNVKMETREKAFDNELLTESEDAAIEETFVKASDETVGEENQCEKTNEGNEIILNEVSKEEVNEDEEVTETSYSTSHSEELTKDGSGEDELKDKLIEDMTNEALETTCQNEELLVEAQNSTENDIIEKQIVCEEKTVEDPGQASVARIETATVTEEESSIELSQPEGSKDLAEGNQIIEDIQQPEERTNIASDKQIPRELDPIENKERTSSISKEHAPIDLQDTVEESSQEAEVGDDEEIYPKETEVDNSGEKITDNSGEDIAKESMSVDDWTMVSSSDHVESSTKETFQVTQDMIEEREAKDETGAAQILLVVKPEAQSPAPSSKLPSKEVEHGVSTQVNAVEEKELKEVEILDKDSSDTKTREEICLEKEENKELKAVVEQETIAVQASSTEIKEDPVSHFEDGRKEEQLQNPTSAPPSKEEEGGNTTEKIESEKIEDAEFLQDDNREDVSLQKERLQEDEALAKDENASSQTVLTVKSEEQITNPVATLPSEEQKHETVNEVDKTEEEKVKEEEIRNEDTDGAKTVVEICSEKDETRGPQAVLEGETIASQVIAQESEEKKIEEEETVEDDKSPQSECVRELQGALEDGATAGQTLSGENQPEKLHITTSTLPSEEQEDETKETKVQEDESPEKILEQTREVEEASNVKMETRENAFDNELLIESEDAAIQEKLDKARNETAGEESQLEKTNEGNEIILNEVSKEEVNEDEEVTETSFSTSHSEELTKDGSGEDELKDKLIEDKTNEALETTCQNVELLVEVQKSTEINIIEKQIIGEDKTVEDPGQASVARIETATVTEEESSIELSQAEGTKDLAEGNQIIDDIQQPKERTNIASDKQIPRELDENTEITSSIGKEHLPIDLQDRVAESSQKAEVEDAKEISPKEAEVDRSGEKTTDNSGEDIAKESTSVEDWTIVSSSDHIESSTKETLQVTQDMIQEREAKDESGAAQILLVEKPEEQSPAPSSKLPSEEGEHGVSTQVDAVEEKELKEVEILDKDFSDTKTREEICLEKEENKELKAVVEQETIAVQAPSTEIKEDPVSHFEDELKDKHTGDKKNETLEVPTYEIQTEELSMETLKDGANNNIEKEIVAEDETAKDLEQAPVGMKEATISREEIPGEADPIESRTISSIGKEHFPTEQRDRALETSDKAEIGDLEPGNAQEICSEAVVDHREEQKTDNPGVEITQEPASADSATLSLSDLLPRSTREKMQVSEHVIEERELTVSKEEPYVEEAETIQDKEAKTEEEKNEGEEGDEHNKTDSGSDAPVMVEAPRDTDTKPHKKSHSILSGVGSKVKHSISKVRKAITGKSSHSKEPKPISPKGSEK